MSHEELRALLPGYAAGALGAEAAEAVRSHLASGCAECLADLYRRPVGLVPPPPAFAPPWPVAPEPARARRGCGAPVVVAFLVATAAAIAGWTVQAARERAAERDALAGRVAEAERRRDELAVRLGALAQEVAAAQGEATRQAEAVRATAEESATLRRDLEAAETRIEGLVRRNRAIEHQLGVHVDQRSVELLVGTPGVELLPLAPVPPFQRARGHVLLHPARDTVVVYVFDLPVPPEARGYRARLRCPNGGVEEARLQPGPHGDASLAVRMPGPATCLRDVEVILEPAGATVLAAHRTPTAR